MSQSVLLILDELELDPRAIAQRALKAPGRPPTDVIEEALDELGLGSYDSSSDFRLAYSACASAYTRLMSSGSADSLSAADLWTAYAHRRTQADIARERRCTHGEVKRRSHALGFILERDFGNRMQFVVTWGPCLGCGAELQVQELDDDHLCEGCR